MSGHSKWSKVKQKKGAIDAKRSASFSKLSKAVTIAARDGGGDPAMNFKLRMAMDKAKAGGLPKDKVEKAILRGTGEGDSGQIEEVIYEAFSPGGVGMLIECLSDNTNRTVAEVKHIVSKSGGTMAGPGSVMWMFDRKGVIRVDDVSKISDRDAFELATIDAGAEDIRDQEDGVEIITEMSDLQKVVEALSSIGIDPDSAELEYLPKDPVAVDEKVSESIMKLCEALDENDDVNNIYTNEV
ncbi:MAG: YebC/PmpR family DNA-binding transcriptional regulator [Candidatus Uhrbacteria bacterium]